MEIKSLSSTELPKIVDCLLEAFKDYFVPMPTSVAYWENRFRGARVDFDLSFGAFDQGKLVGFIIQGIDQIQGEWVAFNAGTGVVEAYRGKQIVDQLYAVAIPACQSRGIHRWKLEVIQQNARAIRVYERIGFSIDRELKCFKGEIQVRSNPIQIVKRPFEEVMREDHLNSWDNQNAAIQKLQDTYDCYVVLGEMGEEIGYFVINETGASVAQLESKEAHFEQLLAGIKQVSPSFRINNIDAPREKRIEQLIQYGLENTIDQYEMEMRSD